MKPEDDENKKLTCSEFLNINIRLWNVVVPAILSQLLCTAMETIGMGFVGHLDDVAKTAGVGLSMTYVNVICQSTLTGLNNALTVLVAIAYGQEDLKRCELLLSRGRLLCTIFFIPLIFIMLKCEDLLLYFEIEEEVAENAQKFTIYMIPAMFFHMQFDCYRQYLNATQQSKVVLFAFLTTILLHFYWCHMLINEWGWDFQGAAVAQMITSALNLLFVMFATTCCTRITIKPFVFSKRLLSWSSLKEYLSISLPSMTMLCSEWWAYEILTIMASMISVPALGAQTIAYNFYILMFMFPFGFQIGSTTCVGNAIGEKNIRLAKIFSRLSVLYSFIIASILAVLIYFYKHEIATSYTEDEETVPLLEEALQKMSVAVSLVGIALALQGSLKALRKQILSTLILILTLYFISIPTAYNLSIERDMGIGGLWYGFTGGVLIEVFLYGMLVIYTDWDDVVAISTMRRDSVATVMTTEGNEVGEQQAIRDAGDIKSDEMILQN